MKKFWWKIIGMLVATAMTISLCGCLSGVGKETSPVESLSSPQAEETNNQVLTIAYTGTDSMNPLTAQTWAEHSVMYLTQAQLVRYYDRQIQPDAAETFERNEDATVYTFHIRDGMKWSNGVPLTAEDYVYGLYCLLSPEMGSQRAGSWFSVKNAEAFASGVLTDWDAVGIRAIDDHTLEFTLEHTDTGFERVIASKHLYPLEQSFFEQIGYQEYGNSAENALYSGAYIVESMELNERTTLKKNPQYWDAENEFAVDEIQLLEVSDANTQVALFENGEVDVVAGIAGQYNEMLSDYAYNVIGGGFEFLWFNQNGTSEETARLLSNVNFRMALSYALNRYDVAASSNSANEAANYIIDPSFLGPDGTPFYEEYPVSAVPLAGDPVQAQAYLTKALEEEGYQDVSEIPELTLVTFAYDAFKYECETMMDQWKQTLGLNQIHLVQYDAPIAISTFYSMDYDIFCISWETNTRPSDILQSMMTGGEANAGIWSNPEYDALVTVAMSEVDSIAQSEMIQKAEQILMDDGVITPLYVEGWVHAVRHNVIGYQVGNGGDGFEFQKLTMTGS